MTIREYTPADKELVVQLLRLNTPEFFAASEEKDLIEYLDNHAQHYFVVETDRELIGCGGFNLSDDRTDGRISWDIFHPQHQGKGLGSMLVKYRIDKLLEYESVKSISVRTSQVAFRFYQKLGFELKEIVRDYWAEGFDLYRMEYSV